MLFESAHVRVAAEYGTATLWLNFPGEPVNALDLARLWELEAALAAVEHNPFVNVLVVRSAKPAGFCAGVHPAALASLAAGADRAAFAWYGQRVLDRLARLEPVTLAFLDGPCLGAGLELALACDHRLCVARPTTHLGFPDTPRGIPPGFGGSVRLRQLIGRRAGDLLTSGRTLSGREAKTLGLVDHAFCERRAKIELRTFLDRLERSPWRAGGCESPGDDQPGFAAERRAFARALGTAAAREAIASGLDALRPLQLAPPPVNPAPLFPAVIGLVGEDGATSRIAAEAVLRGGELVVRGTAAGVSAEIARARARGFVTPLEAEQANARVKVSDGLDGFDRAGVVFVAGGTAESLAGAVRPRCVVAVAGPLPDRFPHPRRVVGIRFPSASAVELSRGPHTDSDTLAALAAWLRPFGLHPTITAADPTPMSEPLAA